MKIRRPNIIALQQFKSRLMGPGVAEKKPVRTGGGGFHQTFGKIDTVESRFNAVIFSHNTHNRRPVRASYGSPVMSSNLSQVAASSCACYVKYCLIFDRVKSREHCILNI